MSDPVTLLPSADGWLVGPDGAQPMMRRLPGAVTLADREGVFAHAFKCSVCDLEFVLFSWRRDRHGVGRTSCPECGEVTAMLHWRSVLSTSRAFAGEGDAGTEIWQMVPLPGAELLDDSAPPGPERFTAAN